jgi:hypothetical protein
MHNIFLLIEIVDGNNPVKVRVDRVIDRILPEINSMDLDPPMAQITSKALIRQDKLIILNETLQRFLQTESQLHFSALVKTETPLLAPQSDANLSRGLSLEVKGNTADEIFVRRVCPEGQLERMVHRYVIGSCYLLCVFIGIVTSWLARSNQVEQFLHLYHLVDRLHRFLRYGQLAVLPLLQ